MKISQRQIEYQGMETEEFKIDYNSYLSMDFQL